MSERTPEEVRLTPFEVPDDGDDVTAESVGIGFEGIGNGTEWCSRQLDLLADLDALRAVSSPTEGMTRRVRGYGMYVFDADAINPDTPPFAIEPSSGPGAWLHEVSLVVNVANGLAFLNGSSQLLVAAGGFPTFSSARTLTRQLNVALPSTTYALIARAKTVSFTPGGSTVIGGPAVGEQLFIQSGTVVFPETPGASATSGLQYCIDELLQDGATIASVVASVQGAAGHAALPGTQCSMGLFRKTRISNTLTSLRSAGDFLNDAQASTAAYQAQHDFTLTPDQNNVVDKATYTYFLQFWNEFGTNALENLKIYGIEIGMSAIADMRFP